VIEPLATPKVSQAPKVSQVPLANPLMSREIASTWPDGWYLYENGKLNGPLTASDAFALPPETEGGVQRLVSRKGFTQWYPLSDLAQIFQLTAGMEKKLESATKATKAAKATMIAPKPSVRTKSVGPRSASAQVASGLSETSALRKAVSESAAQSAAPASPVPKTTAKKAIVQEYYLARSRLRLGQLRNPWATAVGSMPLTLGSYWAFWYASTQREIEFHTQGAVAAPKWLKTGAAMSLLPIVNIWFTYKLAAKVREMESQNKYGHISPALAAVMAILPPLALGYLQSALNRHWLLHAKHLILKRRAEAAAAAATM